MKIFLCLFILTSAAHAKQLILNFDFNRGAQGWIAGFADFPTGERAFYELQAGIRPLPPEISRLREGYMVNGNNHSDDLYMYLYRRLSRVNGLKPLTSYWVNYQITFNSDAPTGCFGAGGAPGESVYLKAGAINRRPTLFVDPQNYIRTTFSHQPLVSNVANGISCEKELHSYRRLIKRQSRSTVVTTNRWGEMWLIVGTDSGFESTTKIYFEKIKVWLKER